MESDSDGEEEVFSGMKLPPLINQLKRILAEYPDGGQILKELIQNAEDAGATEVKLVYDQRIINQGIQGGKEYRKFFKGPALCVYNNALFQKEDWEGIQMIDMSVKESEPLKVGRFGLGFKSVFHLTDYPCVISGDKILLIDPQKERDKVNAMMRLDRLDRYKRMDVEACYMALGSFGINRNTLQKGFPGTLFWFPLRDTESKLSSNLYNKEKVMALLESIKQERHSLIIFLKSLTCIKIDLKTSQDHIRTYVVVEVENAQEVNRKRKTFKDGIDHLTEHDGEAVQCALEMKVNTSVLSDDEKTMKKSSRTWLVVNYFMGTNASAGFKRLINDEELGLCPYVSIGSPLSGETIEGHVFCFLPLPREDTSLTGLPVHINGFFALNQARHHVKWSTEEQRGHRISDKNVMWNKYLITEALPLAYHVWFQCAQQLAQHFPNDVHYITAVHNAIPVSEKIKGKWRELMSPLFRQIEDTNILFSCNQSEWVTPSESLFQDTTYHVSDESERTVVKALTLMGENYVKIPQKVVDTLIEHCHLETDTQLVSPSLLSQMLQNDRYQRYNSLSLGEKMKLFEFLLQEDDISILENLELLPLASGRWVTFTASAAEPVYLCDAEEFILFLGMEDKLLLPDSKLPGDVFRHFESISKTGYYQLEAIKGESEIKSMLRGVIEIHMSNNPRMTLKKTSKICNLEWLQNVWAYLLRRSAVTVCETVPLIPLLIKGNWKNPEVQLVNATNKLIMKEKGKSKIPDEVVNCLRALSIDVVPSLPEWLPFREIKSYIYVPDPNSLVHILSYIQQHNSHQEQHQIVTHFNNIERSWRKMFMVYLCETDEPLNSCKPLLKELQMFGSVQSPSCKSEMLCVAENRYFVTFDTFPINLPFMCINGSEKSSRMLQQLGAKHVKKSDIIIKTLENIHEERYREKDILVFMKYFVDNFDSIIELCSEGYQDILKQSASQISFVKAKSGLKKPSDLFDPTDKTLQDLFKGEFKFPEGILTDKIVKTLRRLGLKSQKQLTANDIVTSGKLLDNWSRNRKNGKETLLKSKALTKILSTYPRLLEEYYEGLPMKQVLCELEIIEPRKGKTASFPQWLPWYSHLNLLERPSNVKQVAYASLVGSVMPVVECSSEHVSSAFLWDSNIPTEALIKQHQIVKEKYKAQYKTELLGYLQQLYQWLNMNMECQNTGLLTNVDIIWVGKQFCTPDKVFTTKQENDLNLKPFYFCIPAEFGEFSEMFENLGCHRYQNIDVLLDTLSKIQESNNNIYCSLTVEILRRLADSINDISVETIKEILIPIHNESSGGLELKRLEDCTYTEDPYDYLSDDEDDDEEDTINLVHKSVPVDVAAKLGIRSLQRRHLINTEEIYVEEWGQHEPLTTRLKTLIDESYVDGLSVPKELLQNADDAGATCLKILYDERENLDSMESLLNQGMRTCHGPSLWIYNNAKFSDKDFVNIAKLNAATKKENMQTIGKFGLGFCSVYNLTDVPSIVSGSNIVIFDPHTTHLRSALTGTSPGLKIDLMKKGNIKLLKRNKDQFKPYNGIFGCDLCTKTPYYDGTLIRLPLRSIQESSVSEIKPQPYSQNDVSELLKMLIDNAINLLIFMQNVQKIEVYHLNSSAKSTTEQKLLFRVSSKPHQHQEYSDHKSVLSQFTCNQSTISEMQKLYMHFEVFEPIQSIKPKLDINPTKLHSCWIISWATGTRMCRTLLQDPYYKSNLPLAAVAVPLYDDNSGPKCLSQVGKGSFKSGRLYCFLPIPCDTQLPWHLHGCFDVTSDRRQLRVVTEQDKPTHRMSWNKCILEDAAVNAFIQLLEHLTEISPMSNYVFHELWPNDTSPIVQPFVKSFFRFILTEDVKIFEAVTGWFCFKDIVMLDPDIKKNKRIGEIAFKMLQNFPIRANKVIVDVPHQTIAALRRHNAEGNKDKIDSKIVRCEEMMKCFFLNISSGFWDTKSVERNEMVKYALKSESDIIHQLLRNTRCIPCTNSFELKRPGELIHPHSSVSAMFCNEDDLFPALDFSDKPVLDALIKHGMINLVLPVDMLLQRVQSIQPLAKQCTTCAKSRIKAIIDYLSKTHIIEKYDESDFHVIRDTFWLPVLQKSGSWKFTWYADRKQDLKIISKTSCSRHNKRGTRLIIGMPSKLYEYKDRDYVSSVSNVIDGTELGAVNLGVWQKIGILNINSHTGFRDLVNHLAILCDEYDPKMSNESFPNIYTEIVKMLQKGITQNEENKKVLKPLSEKQVVLLDNGELVVPCQVAFEVKEPCYPLLCKLPEQNKQFSEFYKAVGVCDVFSIESIISALTKKSQDKGVLKKEDINQVIKLLNNLVDFFERNDKAYLDYKEYHDNIVGPDNTGCLYPTHELAIDDQAFVSNVHMKIIHDAFPRSLAKALGIKDKKLKCLQHIGIGIPWGQKEKLETRIQGILKDYPCDDSILKELLQNADDANAKELHFIMDFRTHSTDKILGNGNLQGPSLCVYNDGYFTEKDLWGITYLGIGSKRKDASKTGQFGIGFNAVYHITDTPSLLTKGPGLDDGVLLVFDPLCCEIPVDQTDPGLRLSESDVQGNFPHSLSGFLVNDRFFKSGKGTMFRFPLRRKPSTLSKHTLTETALRSLLQEFSDNIFDILLFVKSVEKIQVSSITDNQLKHEYSLTINITEEDRQKREQFFNTVKTTSAKNENALDNLKSGQVCVDYVVDVKDSKGMEAKWIIFQTFGCLKGEIIDERIIEAFKDELLSHLPIGGVAVPYPDFYKPCADQPTGRDRTLLSTVSSYVSTIGSYFNKQPSLRVSQASNRGKLFAFLPLPVETGFIIHINANFSLTHSRRDVWKEGYRNEWNKFLGEKTIIVSWIDALKFLHKYFMPSCLSENGISSQKQIMQMFNKYHALFPVLDNLTHEFSRVLVKQFYDTVYMEKTALFPVTYRNDESFSITWVPLKPTEATFGAVFKDKNTENAEILHAVLKNLGMCLVETPIQIYNSLTEIGYNEIPVLNPDFVINFLHTFQSSQPGSCSIGVINTPIENTRFLNVGNLKCIVEYIRKTSHFLSKIEKLPILITADGKVHMLGKRFKIYHSEFVNLLPNSKSVFVHGEIINLFSEDIFFSEGFLHRLDIEDFETLLRSEVIEGFKTGAPIGWDKTDADMLITPAWISKFFSFIELNTRDDDSDFVTAVTQSFNQYSFLPAVSKMSQHESKYELLPLSLAFRLYHDYSYNNRVHKIVHKLNLPTLDISVFKHSGYSLKRKLYSMVSNTRSPLKLLKCLHHHKRKIKEAQLEMYDANDLLSYFKSHLEELNVESSLSRQYIRELPLHLSYEGNLVNLKTAETLILPFGIPKEGIREWASSLNRTVLREKSELKNLYDYLGLSGTNKTEFYAKCLVPTIDRLPQQHWITHFKEMRTLINTQDSNSKNLLAKLQNLPLFRIGNELKRACELYWHGNGVFRVMLEDSFFPPKEYRDGEWECFCKSLGMQFDVTEELFIDFAISVEEAGRQHISNQLMRKSTILFSYFISQDKTSWKKVYLNTLKSIKFIVPCKPARELETIYDQPDLCTKLMAFSQSVSVSHSYLCWSSMDMLSNLPRDEGALKMLDIYEEPPLDKVILHCQNITVSLQDKLKTGTISQDLVKEIMEKIYAYFKKQSEIDLRVVARRLEMFPIIYIPLHHTLAKAKAVVINIDVLYEIKPILYKAPLYYGKYFDFFEKIGSKSSFDINHCVYVFQELKLKVGDTPMTSEELHIVKKVLTKMIEICRTCTEIDALEGVIYLPNRKNILKDSRQLTVSDNGCFELMLKDVTEIDYFSDFDAFNIKTYIDIAAFFRKFPSNARPAILTDVVSEGILEDEIEIFENSPRAAEIQEFLHCEDFIQGYLRLVKSHMTRNGEEFDYQKHAPYITKKIRSIHVVSALNLKAVLSYRGSMVSGTETRKTHFIKIVNTEQCIFYLSENEIHKPVIYYNRSIAYLLRACTEYEIDCIYLPELLLLYENTAAIQDKLDSLRIEGLNMPQRLKKSVFPSPGKRVENHFLPFLEEAIKPFEKDEYDHVAMELEDFVLGDSFDESIEDNTTVYIYVHILREIVVNPLRSDIHRKYLVKTGNDLMGYEEVPIYRLYRFVRRNNSSTELVVYDTEPVGAIPFDDTCHRIRDMLQEAWTLPELERRRIIKRLIRKWHPDKNPGNEEYCQEVLNYINSAILLLEEGQQVSDVVDRRSYRHAPNMSQSSYHKFVMNVCHQATVYARAYINNVDEYNRDHGTGRYNHTLYVPRPDILEARRWMRQAKNDFRAANAFSSKAKDTEGNNWICYTCHQAREKALRAAHFSKNANDVPGRTHSLRFLAQSLGQDLKNQFLTYFRLGHYNHKLSIEDIDEGLMGKITDTDKFSMRTHELIQTRDGNPIREYDSFKRACERAEVSKPQNITRTNLRTYMSTLAQVAVIEGRLNDHNMMRYPNCVSRPNIPSDLYTEDHANVALEKTKELLDAVEDEFNIH